MRKYFPLLLLIPFVFAQAEIPWKIEFSRARLIYNVTIPAGYSGYFIYFQIPHSFIDNLIQYYVSKGWNVSNFITNLWPRVYYYNTTTGEQIQIPCRVANISADEGIPFCLYTHFYTTPYGNVPDELVVYYSNTTITPGNHTFLLYYPFLLLWEDWETEYRGKNIETGQCFNNKWCVLYGSAIILWGGAGVTPKKSIAAIENTILYKDVNITLQRNTPIILEYNAADHAYGASERGASVCLLFRLKNNTTKAICYCDYAHSTRCIYPPRIDICYKVRVGWSWGWHTIKRDVMEDLARYCGITPQNIIELKRIYIGLQYDYLNRPLYTRIDNLKLVVPTP